MLYTLTPFAAGLEALQTFTIDTDCVGAAFTLELGRLSVKTEALNADHVDELRDVHCSLHVLGDGTLVLRTLPPEKQGEEENAATAAVLVYLNEKPCNPLQIHPLHGDSNTLSLLEVDAQHVFNYRVERVIKKTEPEFAAAPATLLDRTTDVATTILSSAMMAAFPMFPRMVATDSEWDYSDSDMDVVDPPTKDNSNDSDSDSDLFFPQVTFHCHVPTRPPTPELEPEPEPEYNPSNLLPTWAMAATAQPRRDVTLHVPTLDAPGLTRPRLASADERLPMEVSAPPAVPTPPSSPAPPPAPTRDQVDRFLPSLECGICRGPMAYAVNVHHEWCECECDRTFCYLCVAALPRPRRCPLCRGRYSQDVTLVAAPHAFTNDLVMSAMNEFFVPPKEKEDWLTLCTEGEQARKRRRAEAQAAWDAALAQRAAAAAAREAAAAAAREAAAAAAREAAAAAAAAVPVVIDLVSSEDDDEASSSSSSSSSSDDEDNDEEDEDNDNESLRRIRRRL